MITVAIRNASTVLTDSQVSAVVPSMQKQVTRDFAPAWGIDAKVVWLPRGTPLPAGAWLVVVLDTADQAGALGYHDLTTSGAPMSKIFAKTTIQDGGLWTVTLSHEILEMLVDPNINLCALDDRRQRLYAYEVCDSPEADVYAYDIDGVKVSDFVFPGWFEPNHVSVGEKFAFHSKITRPFQLLPGGYISMLDMRGAQGWQQLTARASVHGEGGDAIPEEADARKMDPGDHPTHHSARAHVGSRRERRRIGSAHWQRSKAE